MRKLPILEENEEKKKYLKGYIYCKRREAQLAQQIDELRSQKMSPGINNDGMPHGNAYSDLSGYMARLDDLISQLEHEREMAVKRYKEIYDQIHTMQDGAEKEVLERRYLLGQKWESIAVAMDYDYRYVLKIHGRALKLFELRLHETSAVI